MLNPMYLLDSLVKKFPASCHGFTINMYGHPEGSISFSFTYEEPDCESEVAFSFCVFWPFQFLCFIVGWIVLHFERCDLV